MDTMPTTSFTTRIDTDLKAELEEIARMENRSASFMANQAIRSLVEERKATRELIEVGLEMVEAGAPTIAPDDIHAWLLAEDENAPFPEARPRS
jgi:predicted transcriptional regulator